MALTVRDIAKAAACDERDRLGAHATDYQVGCMVEAALAIMQHRPYFPAARCDVIEAFSRELGVDEHDRPASAA